MKIFFKKKQIILLNIFREISILKGIFTASIKSYLFIGEIYEIYGNFENNLHIFFEKIHRHIYYFEKKKLILALRFSALNIVLISFIFFFIIWRIICA